MIVKRIKLYSEEEEKKGRTKLKDVKSHRGLGRSLLIAQTPAALGGYIGKKAANKADAEGKTDEEIKKIATKKATKAGALIGGLTAASTIAACDPRLKKKGYNKKLRAAIAATTAANTVGLGALGARLGAKKNTKVRLDKRKKMDQE